jgi:ubiquinone/menaquinone biosynthesis C-methylase UbiE
MLELSRVESHHRVLDAATGPGFVALLFAERARYVVGVDLTRALLQKAKALQRERRLCNAAFVEGEVGAIPVRSEMFDVVTCHKAFHHFPEPERALAEMRRVLRPGGRLVLGDTLSSEDPEKSVLHNRLERMRDPSHVKMYPLSELAALIERAGFQIDDVAQFHDERDFDTWMATITPSPEVIEEIREIMLESIPEDRTGQRLRVEDGRLYYTRFAAVVAAVKA